MENLDFEKKLEDILIKEKSVGLLTGRMGGMCLLLCYESS